MIRFRRKLGLWKTWLSRPFIVLVSTSFSVIVYYTDMSPADTCSSMVVMTTVMRSKMTAVLLLRLNVVLGPCMKSNRRSLLTTGWLGRFLSAVIVYIPDNRLMSSMMMVADYVIRIVGRST